MKTYTPIPLLAQEIIDFHLGTLINIDDEIKRIRREEKLKRLEHYGKRFKEK